MPPRKSPNACVVLYTPMAKPFRCGGARRDTSDGCSASSRLSAIKNSSRKTTMPVKAALIAKGAAIIATNNVATAPRKTSRVFPRFSAASIGGIIAANDSTNTGA